MKKIICLALAALLSVSLFGCGGKNEPDLTTTIPEVTETEAETTEIIDETDETTEPASFEEPSETLSEAETEGAKKPETMAEIVEYFNEVINNVKPKSKTIVQNYTLNSQASDLVLGKAKSLEGLANSLIEANMGYNKEATNRVMTGRADKDKYFAVEGMSWSSKLTPDDVKSAKLTEKDGVYTITIEPKDDAPSANTVKSYGHIGKAMSVVPVSSITENAGAAKSIIKNIKTGHRNAKIVATVDAATGNVTHANYYFVWDLCLTALRIDLTVSFGIEQDYDIKW